MIKSGKNPPHRHLCGKQSLPTSVSSPVGRGRAFTMADQRSRSQSDIHLLGYLPAFTMAEILISLTIIGIIAAITLPALRANINEATWNTQRKALYSRISQAVSLLPYINGYGVGTTQAETNNNAAMSFVTDGLAKVLQINNICDSEHLQDCGLPNSFKKFKSVKKITFPKTLHELNSTFGLGITKNIKTKVTAFETKNGESIAVYYNPACINNDVILDASAHWTSTPNPRYVLPYMCADFIYDLNGKKGPNAVGKDIWYMTLIYSNKMELFHFNPDMLTEYFSVNNYSEALSHCAQIDARFANIEEGIANAVNNKLTNTRFGYLRNSQDSRHGYLVNSQGILVQYGGGNAGVRCIRRSRK